MDRTTTEKRLMAANNLLATIASCTSLARRGDFKLRNRLAHLSVDSRGRVWFFDGESNRYVYTHYPYRWKHFSQGGTARKIVEYLRDFIKGKCDRFKGHGYVCLFVDAYSDEEKSIVLEVSRKLMEWSE